MVPVTKYWIIHEGREASVPFHASFSPYSGLSFLRHFFCRFANASGSSYRLYKGGDLKELMAYDCNIQFQFISFTPYPGVFTSRLGVFTTYPRVLVCKWWCRSDFVRFGGRRVKYDGCIVPVDLSAFRSCCSLNWYRIQLFIQQDGSSGFERATLCDPGPYPMMGSAPKQRSR